MTKGSVLGSSLKNLSVAIPDARVQPAAKPVTATSTMPDEKETPIGVHFRLNRRDHEAVSEYARDKGWSMQELLEHGVNALRRADGLSEITGRPRGKKAGSHSK